MTILLVDDDEDDVEIIVTALRRIDGNLNIIVSHDGIDCLKLLETILPDFILLDINMPLMNGRDCLAAIRKNPSLKDPRVIMHSTSIFPRDIEFFEKNNASYYVKPSDYKSLKEKLEQIIFQKHIELKETS